jgi:hypothetical protein
MQIVKKRLRKFKSLYRTHFNEHLSDKEILRKAEKLLSIYTVVYDISMWSKRDVLKDSNNNNYEKK